MSIALETICGKFGMKLADEPATRVVALKIIELAQRGVRDAPVMQGDNCGLLIDYLFGGPKRVGLTIGDTNRATSHRVPVISEHKFKIGERLFPARSVGLDVSEGAYVVVKRLPKHDGEFEYQIKSVNETDDRIVRESQLKPSPWRNQA